MGEQLIGAVTHYYGHLGVAAIELTAGELRVGDTVRVAGNTTEFTQEVGSMQIEHEDVELAAAGDHIGLKVIAKARLHDQVYRVAD